MGLNPVGLVLLIMLATIVGLVVQWLFALLRPRSGR